MAYTNITPKGRKLTGILKEPVTKKTQILVRNKDWRAK